MRFSIYALPDLTTRSLIATDGEMGDGTPQRKFLEDVEGEVHIHTFEIGTEILGSDVWATAKLVAEAFWAGFEHDSVGPYNRSGRVTP